MITTVGAYIELPLGEQPSPYDHTVSGAYIDRSDQGLNVVWMDEVPEGAQVYLYWEPRVYAVWSQREEDNGEDGDSEDGSDVEQRDEEVPPELDERSGEGGEGNGDVPSAETPIYGDEGSPDPA